jgi:hypothetical protein
MDEMPTRKEACEKLPIRDAQNVRNNSIIPTDG